MNIYKNKYHKNWRESVLRNDGYLCQSCKRNGINRDGTHAHHILPVDGYAQYSKKVWNGVALCTECHNKLEPRTGEYDPPRWMLHRIPVEIEHGF